MPPTAVEAVEGEMVTELTAGDAAPVPTSCTTKGLELALVVRERLPVTLPEVLASNVTVKVWLCPGVKLTGVVKPAMLKPLPVTLAWLMLKLLLPTLVAVTLCDVVLPTVVLTETLVGLTESFAAACWPEFVGALAMPVHPDVESVAIRTAKRNTRSEPRFSREECM